MFKTLNPEKMTKAEMISLVAEYVRGQEELFERVCAEEENYTLADWLYECTEVDIKSVDNVKNLSDEEFKTFFENIVFDV